jgi:hypothetical protein
MGLLRLPLVLAKIPFQVAKAAISVAGGLLSSDEPERPVAHWEVPRPAPRPAANGGRPARPVAAGPSEPVHASEQPEVVAEVAERGAEEGAGAEVRVDEPWPGYTRMTAAQIRTRLAAEPPTVAAAVSLYEAGNKGRTSVLEAATRRTRG